MGELAGATPQERIDRRALAEAITNAVINDEPSPLYQADAIEDARSLARSHYDDFRSTMYSGAATALIKAIDLAFDELREADRRAFGLAQELVDSTKSSDACDHDVEVALACVRRASRGPARWTNPATGVDADGYPHNPLIWIADQLGESQPTRRGSVIKSMARCLRELDIVGKDFIGLVVHGVSVPVDGGTIADIENGGEHLVVAITGNGPTSEANARAIAGMFDPVMGWEAALVEVAKLRSELELYHVAAPHVMVSEVTDEDIAKLKASTDRPIIVDSPMTREQAVAIAIEHARVHMPSYFEEPFVPHEWVVQAIMEAGMR